MNRKQGIKAVVFAALFVALFVYVSRVLVAKWTTGNKSTYMASQYYDVDDNSIDVCVIGSSQVVYGFSCMAMYDEYGISAYSFGIDNEAMLSSYYWLKECEKSHDISTVVLDISILFEQTHDSYFRKSFDNMKLSMNKIEAMKDRDKIEGSTGRISYLIPLELYHDRWKELTKQDFVLDIENSLVYRGNVMKYNVLYSDPASYLIDDGEIKDVEMVDYQLEYFRKIVEHCREEQLNLVLIKTPKKSWNRSRSEAVAALAEEYSLPFLEFNKKELAEAAGINFATDIQDPDHLNLRGAEKLSRYVGKYLKEHFEIPDRREDSYNPVDMVRYRQDREDCYLKMTVSVEECLERLNNERYGVAVQMTDDLSGLWSDNMRKLYRELGFEQDIAGLEGQNYIGVLAGGSCVYENSSAEEMSYEGTFSATPFVARSKIGANVREATTLVGESEEAFGARGMNILVYDLARNRIADKITVYRNAAGDGLQLIHAAVRE